MIAEKQASCDGQKSITSKILSLGCLILLIAGCSNDSNTQSPAASDLAQRGDEVKTQIKVDVMEFINNSGIEPTFPQIWVFDKSGTLISTERSYMPGRPLNIEANKQGPVVEEVAKLEKYLTAKNVQFDRWQRCGADYCVVQLMPEASLGECPPCGMMTSRLDAYFSTRGAEASYRTVLLTNNIAPEDRLANP